jgi:glyoxylase-like metal-dependent hydrolase (beta-lactamase superfamily II)
MIPPDDFDPQIGVADTLEPGLRRIVAPNPSPMTYRGTNTYLLGDREITLIDPGPDHSTHKEAILQALKPDQRITRIVVTHAHVDHSPLATRMARDLSVPTVAFGPATSGRSAVMQRLAHAGLVGGGEGVDDAFRPDIAVAHGDTLDVDGVALEVLHTPGHIGNHICLGWNGACFTADHVMGWASSLVSPPDGDLTDFMASCRMLRAHDWRVFYPGHGDLITAPAARLDWLVAHRKGREAEILQALADKPATATDLARRIYVDTPSALLAAATRNVLAHLIDLEGKSQISCDGSLHAEATFRRVR